LYSRLVISDCRPAAFRWAAAELADLPFDQAVKQLTSFDMDPSSSAGSTATATMPATTALPAAPAVAEEAAPVSAEDESGPANGCAPSLANEGFFSRFADTY